MNADYIQHWGSDLVVVNAARCSMDKESSWEDDVSKMTTGADHNGTYWNNTLRERDVKLVNYLAKHQHYTPFEHCGVTLRLKVPLFVRSQIHRHRTFSFNEVSRRYVKDDLQFYWPDKWRKAAENVKQGSSDEAITKIVVKDFDDEWTTTPEQEAKSVAYRAMAAFTSMVDAGVCAEQSRMILPQNMYTTFYMSGNLRNFCHFLKLRLDSHTQKECRDVAEMCAKIIEPLFPVSYRALMTT